MELWLNDESMTMETIQELTAKNNDIFKKIMEIPIQNLKEMIMNVPFDGKKVMENPVIFGRSIEEVTRWSRKEGNSLIELVL